MFASPSPPTASRSAATRTTHGGIVQAFPLTSLPNALRYTTSAVFRSFHCNAALAFLPHPSLNSALEAAGRADYDHSSTRHRGCRGYGVCASLRSQRCQFHSRPPPPHRQCSPCSLRSQRIIERLRRIMPQALRARSRSGSHGGYWASPSVRNHRAYHAMRIPLPATALAPMAEKGTQSGDGELEGALRSAS